MAERPTVDPGTVLVTGGTGFVGANIAYHLAEQGHRVVAFDAQPAPAIVRQYWAGSGGAIDFEAGSVTDDARLADVFERHLPSYVVHAAAVTAVDREAEARLAGPLVEVNCCGTLRLLEAARTHPVRRFLYISSAGLYGKTDPDVPITEDRPLQEGNLYLTAKETSERLCLRWADLFGMDIVIGRLGQPYGPVERDTGVRSVLSPIYQLARGALEGRKVRMPLPDYSCDWTYVTDLAEAIRLLLVTGALGFRTYNLSNGVPRHISDVMAALEAAIPGAQFDWVEPAEADVDTRSDPRRGPLDISRLRRDVSFQPTHDLESGISAALPWWRAMAQKEVV